MNVAEWIIVAILSVTLFVFLVVGIILIVKLIDLSKEVKEVVIEGQDIAKNTNGIVTNVKGMTSFGGAMELAIDKYIMPKLKEKTKESKEKAKETKEKEGSKNDGKK